MAPLKTLGLGGYSPSEFELFTTFWLPEDSSVGVIICSCTGKSLFKGEMVPIFLTKGFGRFFVAGIDFLPWPEFNGILVFWPGTSTLMMGIWLVGELPVAE